MKQKEDGIDRAFRVARIVYLVMIVAVMVIIALMIIRGRLG